MNIQQANNGFVVTHASGEMYVYKTLQEMADAIEGSRYNSVTTSVYAPGADVHTLFRASSLAATGHKIDAIKELRNAFVPRLGLKEAKDIIEAFTYK